MISLTGKTILHYKIMEKLGEGGMGVVYLGEDTKLKREVAIKFLPYHITSDNEERKRFEIEAQAAASLNHPNISTIFSIEETEKNIFIVMEYVKGEELKNLMKKDIFPVERTVNIAIQIAEALETAHKKGIVHRDIKPANIMITEEDKVKVMDFGLAKILGGAAQQTKAGLALGTAAYMSPEQALGHEEVDPRTDIFSFGIILYELLSGKYPFKGEYAQSILYSILNEEPPQLNEQTSFLVDDNLCELVKRCLEKDKNERINSFGEILKHLRNYAARAGLIALGSANRQEVKIPDEIVLIKNFIPHKSDIFIGREKHIKILRKKIDRVLSGKGSTIFLCGEPGIGKTQLVYYTIKNFAQSAFYVLYGRCIINEGGLPYHPFVNAIRTNLVDRDKRFDDIISNVAASKGISVTNRIPLIKSFLNLSGDFTDTLLHKEQLWDAALLLFKIISADKPLILVLDDIQWADKASLGLFSFIARNITELPVLLIGIHRPLALLNADNAALVETIRNLRIESLAEKIDIERLSEKETSDVVRNLFGGENIDHKMSRAVYRQSEGNPLFINELVNLMKDRAYVKFTNSTWHLDLEDETGIVSEKVQDVIKQRIYQLDKQSRDILELASCEGEYFRSDILGGCLDIERISLLKILQTLENDYHLIRHEKNFYRFDHLLIREVLYESILPELREEYHRIISLWLINRYSGKDEYASRIAYHLISAGEEQKAIDYLLIAANRARDLYAGEEALSYYEQVLKISEKPTIRVSYENKLVIEEGMGDVCTSLGKAQQALEHFNKYLILARELNKPADEIRALRKYSESFRILGSIGQAESLCTESVELAYNSGDKKDIIESLNILAFINASRGDYSKTIEFSKKACSCSDEINDFKNKSVSLSNMGFAYWHQGNYLPAMEMFNNAISLQRSIGDNRGLSTSLNYLGLLYWKLGKYEQAFNSAEESVKIKKSIGDYRAIPGSLNVIGDIFREIGDLENAISYHSESLKLASEHQNKGAMCDNIRDLGEDYFLYGDLERALGYYLDVMELASSANIKWYETRAYISLSRLYLVKNEPDRAKDYLKLGMEYADKINARELIIESLWNEALIKERENLHSESCRSIEKAINIAVSIDYQTFLWKLYYDYSKILIRLNKLQEAKEAIRKSNIIVQTILDGLTDATMKNTFLNSGNVKELLSFSLR